jgi:hypothetical protein
MVLLQNGYRDSDNFEDRETTMPRIQFRLTPHGHLLLEDTADAPFLDDEVAARLADAFGRASGHGLLQLGAGEVDQSMPPTYQRFAIRKACIVADRGMISAATIASREARGIDFTLGVR